MPPGAWVRVVLLAVGVSAADRVTKLAALAFLADGRSVPVIPGVLHLTLVLNTGGAFGLLKDARFFFIPFSLAAIAGLLYYLYRYRPGSAPVITAVGLIVGGAFGNMIDRLRYGHVVDFLDLRVWPVFNVADSAITVGAALLVWSLLTRRFRHTPG